MFFKFIQTSCTGVVQTFGKYTGTVGPGLRLFFPFIQTITPVSNRLKQETFQFEAKTKDNVFTQLGIAIQYRIKPSDTDKAYFSLANPVDQIDSYVENVIRSKVPSLRLDELFESQDSICQSVSEKLSKNMSEHGFTIENTLVTAIDPDLEVKRSMNAINASERMKEAVRNKAEAHYIEELKQAEADRDRKRLQGEGISQQRLAIMEGYEKGIHGMSERMGLDPREIVKFVEKVQELDTMETIGRSNNSKILFFEREYTDSDKINFNFRKNMILANETK